MDHSFSAMYAQSFAIKELAKLGPAAKPVVPELISLFQARDDYVGDGGWSICYRSDIARALGDIGQPAAIRPMVELLREKSLSANLNRRQNPNGVRWHLDYECNCVKRCKHLAKFDSFRDCRKELENYQCNCQEGMGPEGILTGLMRFPSIHHSAIRKQLIELRAEVESSNLENEWTKEKLDRAIQFLGR